MHFLVSCVLGVRGLVALEKVFSSKGPIRILKVLTEILELHVSDIAKRTGLNYSATNQHLRVLENLGLVRHKKYGRVRFFLLDETNLGARMLRELIEAW